MLSFPKETTSSIVHFIIYIFFFKINFKWKEIKTIVTVFVTVKGRVLLWSKIYVKSDQLYGQGHSWQS